MKRHVQESNYSEKFKQIQKISNLLSKAHSDLNAKLADDKKCGVGAAEKGKLMLKINADKEVDAIGTI